MFMNKKSITNTIKDSLGKTMSVETKTLYLLDGQVPNPKTEDPSTQKLYKEIYMMQQTKEIELGRPVTIFELYNMSLIK